MSWWQCVLENHTLGLLLPMVVAIVAVITGGTIAVVKLVFRHRERMAMIQQGMNPDQPAPPGPSGGKA
ncbi:MAG: hypothetical protein ABSG86_11445 [Thermoguttaceae bacterium]|jgi:uncharacterized membrane protein (DUF106 family)